MVLNPGRHKHLFTVSSHVDEICKSFAGTWRLGARTLNVGGI